MKIASDSNKPKLERQSMQWILNNTKNLTRYGVIYVLIQIDPNGIWSDDDTISECNAPLSFVEAVEYLLRFSNDFNPLDIQIKNKGFNIPIGVSNITSLESYARNYYDCSYADLSDKEKWSVVLGIS